MELKNFNVNLEALFNFPHLFGKVIASVIILTGVTFIYLILLRINLPARIKIFSQLDKRSFNRFISFTSLFLIFYGLYVIWEPFLKVFNLQFLKAVIIVLYSAVFINFLTKFINFVVTQVIESSVIERSFSMVQGIRFKQRRDTLARMIVYVFDTLFIFIFLLIVLDNLGINLRAILATAGVASIAFGFGAQSLIKDFINGFFIIWEDQFAVGDIIVTNEEGGMVEKMTLRITQLRNTEGTLITLPNSEIKMVKNYSNEWSRVDFRVGVAYATDLDRAIRVINEEAAALAAQYDKKIIGEPQMLGVDELGDSSIVIRLWIKTKPLEQWEIKRIFNKKIKERFDKEGIEIPFPQRTVWMQK